MATFSRDTVYAPLRLSRLYNLLQRFVGGGRDRAAFMRTHVVFRSDEKVVDAGCGTGGALEFLPLVNYFGFDPNPITFVWHNHDMGAVENSSAEMPAAYEFGSWRGMPMRFFRWECSITLPTSRLTKYWAWHEPVCVPAVVSSSTSLASARTTIGWGGCSCGLIGVEI
jgi:hypothetical protein